MVMGVEAEAKYLVLKPDRAEKIGLEAVVDQDIDSLRQRIEQLAPGTKEEYHFYDKYFAWDSKTPQKRSDFLDNVVLEDDNIVYPLDNGNEGRLKVVPNHDEFEGFISLLSNLYLTNGEPKKYKMRIRQDDISGRTTITIKYKHSRADELNQECQLDILSSAEEFIEKIGFEYIQRWDKEKIQERWTYNFAGESYQIEINTIPQLGNGSQAAIFLEIEKQLDSLTAKPLTDIQQIAQGLGIDTRPVEEGGARVDKGYKKLIKAYNN
jgi:hypothetical protein